MHKFKNNLAHAFSLNSRSATLTICFRAFTNSPLPSPPTPHNFVTRFSFFVNLSKKYHLPPSPAPPSTRQAPANQTPLTMFFRLGFFVKKIHPPPSQKKKKKKRFRFFGKIVKLSLECLSTKIWILFQFAEKFHLTLPCISSDLILQKNFI